MLDRMDRGLRTLERMLEFAAGAALVLMMVSIFADVIGRHLLGSSLNGVHELVEMYLMAAVVFLSISRAQDLGKHIAVDALVQKFRGLSRSAAHAIACTAGLLMLAPVAWKSSELTVEHYVQGRVTSGVIEFPSWIGWAAVAVGCGTISLRFAIQLIKTPGWARSSDQISAGSDTGSPR